MSSHSRDRFHEIKKTLLAAPVHLCTERARLITDFFRKHNNPNDPVVVQKAKAFRHLMSHKSCRIFPRELIVGNIGSHRKSAIVHPELAGIFVSQDLLWIDRRKTTPFTATWKERLDLIFNVYPYWLTRNMIVRAFWPHIGKLFRYTLDQLNPNYYLINEFLTELKKYLKSPIRK